jgi:steroid delta-isomerase-like uncharacterized protein
MGTTNVRLARRWFEEVWNARNLAVIDELAAPECVGHHEGGETTRSPAEWRQMQQRFLDAIPDAHIDLEEVLGDGEQVVVRWRCRGTHTGRGLDLDPSGRVIDVRGVTWLRYEDGRIVEGWDSWNLGGLLAHLTGR